MNAKHIQHFCDGMGYVLNDILFINERKGSAVITTTIPNTDKKLIVKLFEPDSPDEIKNHFHPKFIFIKLIHILEFLNFINMVQIFGSRIF